MKKNIPIRRHFRRTRKGIRPVRAHLKRMNYGSKWKLFEIRAHNVKNPDEYTIEEMSAPDKNTAKKWASEENIFKERLWRVSDIKEIEPTLEDELKDED